MDSSVTGVERQADRSIVILTSFVSQALLPEKPRRLRLQSKQGLY
jgi:hypothetical protein